MMEKLYNIYIENAASMTEIERLEACFKKVTDTAIQQLENELEVARAMGDEESKKAHHIQIGMFRNTQSIFSFAKRYATDARWKDENAND